MTQAAKFRALHQGPELLVLPNAWDAGSARLVETCGAKAIATSSAAVAWAHGYADGEQLPTATLLATVREILRVATVPVSVDLEGGYHAEPEGIADLIAAVLEAGAVGVNLEDGRGAPELLAAKIGVARRVAARVGRELFVNARTDVYLKNLAEGEAAVAETLRRAAIYRAAGTDGLFVPAVVAPAEIAAITAGAQLPVNVLVRANLPSVAELQRLGVRRLSAGCALTEMTLALARRATRELLESGTYRTLFAEVIPFPEINGWFKRD
jgi:2-methylisocitrate lyase-like PEP mutase family enzyme